TLPNSPPLPSSRPRSRQRSSTSAVSVPAESFGAEARPNRPPAIRPRAPASPHRGCLFRQSAPPPLPVPPPPRAGSFLSRPPLRPRNRVDAEGVEVHAVRHGFGDLRPRDAGAERGAVADALGHRHEVRRHAPVLEAPEVGAGAAEAGLHFVSDAQPTEAVDDV